VAHDLDFAFTAPFPFVWGVYGSIWSGERDHSDVLDVAFCQLARRFSSGLFGTDDVR
jgi:hypothetical protein